jgi:hypothetical protein
MGAKIFSSVMTEMMTVEMDTQEYIDLLMEIEAFVQ